MDPSHSRRRYDAVTEKVMATGMARYFIEAGPTSILDARKCLYATADRFEAFLEGEGRGSKLSACFDDLDVAGLRSAAGWIPANTRMMGADLYGLFQIAISGNSPLSPRQSDTAAYEEFKRRVDSFVEKHKIPTQRENGENTQSPSTSQD